MPASLWKAPSRKTHLRPFRVTFRCPDSGRGLRLRGGPLEVECVFLHFDFPYRPVFLQARNEKELPRIRLCSTRRTSRAEFIPQASGDRQKIISQNSAMTPGLFQKEEWKV